MQICLGRSTEGSDGVDLLRGSSGGHLGVLSLFLGHIPDPHGPLDKEPVWVISVRLSTGPGGLEL